MHSYDANTLIERIHKLEVANSQMKKYGLLAFVVLTSIMVVGWAVKDYPTYEGQFFVRDQNGDLRASLGYNPGDNQGKLMIGRATSTTGSSGEKQITFQTRIWIGNGSEGRPVICANYPDGKTAVSMGASSSEKPGLWFYDKQGNTRMWIGLDEDDEPYVQLYNKNGTIKKQR